MEPPLTSPDPIQEARVREAREQLGMYIEFPIADSESARANAGAWPTEFEAAVRAQERAVILSHDEKVKALKEAATRALPYLDHSPFESAMSVSELIAAALAALEEQTR